MRRDDDRQPTLAGALDRTHWDYPRSKDRRFLLAPLSRILEGIAWGSRPGPTESEPKPEEPDENVER